MAGVACNATTGGLWLEASKVSTMCIFGCLGCKLWLCLLRCHALQPVVLLCVDDGLGVGCCELVGWCAASEEGSLLAMLAMVQHRVAGVKQREVLLLEGDGTDSNMLGSMPTEGLELITQAQEHLEEVCTTHLCARAYHSFVFSRIRVLSGAIRCRPSALNWSPVCLVCKLCSATMRHGQCPKPAFLGWDDGHRSPALTGHASQSD
jgi:hypothetical protein